ncbi:MAG: LemA family protein [Alphaproteobacteria bacterium]|nr:LemA family protein [Alphaproteobacteria bacterium]
MTISKLLPKIFTVLGLSLALAGCGVNSIPAKDQAVKAAWANVQAAYQRRADLIPNLVATVQGYANQEKSVLTEVTNARARATSVTIDASQISDPAALERFQQAQAQLSGALGRLLAVSENYPDLKSNTNFLALQSQLEGTENRIEIARRDYNGAVQDYNTELVTIPGSLWAATIYKSYKQATPFSASAGAQNAPTVNFNTSGPAAPPQPAPEAAQPGTP